jgi:hypothetical protein
MSRTHRSCFRRSYREGEVGTAVNIAVEGERAREEQPVMRTAFETFISLPFCYGQRDPARAPRVVEDGLVSNLGAGGL